MSAPTTTYYDLVKPEYTDPSDIKDLNDNFDAIDTALHNLDTGKLDPVTPTSDPSSSGTAIDFIATLSQAANGTITLTKKAVREMTGANGSTAGTSGLVPAPAATDNTKFLRGDKTWAVPTNTDTKNTAGSTNKASTKMFLVAAASQADNPQTFSNSNCYIGTDSCLYSGGAKVLTAHQDISGKKNTQTAVNDPTVSGTSITFIATLSQNTQGVVSVTKKTVSTFGGASASGNGSAGLVPAPGAGNQSKFLRGDGTWQIPTNTDTKNTAGSTNKASTKMFLVAAASQADNPQTFSNSNCYIGTDNCLYSGGVKVLTGHQSLASCLKTTGDQSASGVQSFTNTTESSSTSTGAVKISGGLGVAKKIYGNTVWNAVWNDYAECRESSETEPGRCVRETIFGTMVKTHKRRMRGCKIISDTFGTCMGETERAKTPIGVAGRVLAYPARDRAKFYLGAPVCSGPNGTVDLMGRLEAILFPECVVGYVSEIPRYEKWVAGTKEDPKEIEVDGRIWIYVR